MTTMICTCSNKGIFQRKQLPLWQKERSVHMSEWRVSKRGHGQISDSPYPKWPKQGWPQDQQDHLRGPSYTSLSSEQQSALSPLIPMYTHSCLLKCTSVRMAISSWPRRCLSIEASIFAHQKAPSNSFPSHCFHFPAAFRPRRPTTRHWKAF